MNELVDFLKPSLNKKVTINLENTPDVLNILGDRTRLHQAFMNIVSNAVYAVKKNGGVVDISFTIESGKSLSDAHANISTNINYLKIIVADSGEGIEQENINKIFDPYFSTKKDDGGTGLGLSVVNGIIESHKGIIVVESKKMKGTWFSVWLPMLNSSSHECSLSGADAEPLQRDNNKTMRTEGIVDKPIKTILVVDDEVLLLDFLKMFLEDYEFNVVAYTDANNTLDDFVQDPDKYDLLISDKNMPNMSGIELARRVREINPELPIIIMSGECESNNDESNAALNNITQIQKPCTGDELLLAINEL